jgi:hypothetical protein
VDGRTATVPQLAGGDPKGSDPHPSFGRFEGAASGRGLSECLRERVVGHISVSRVGDQGPPEPWCLLPVDLPESFLSHSVHRHILLHMEKGLTG